MKIPAMDAVRSKRFGYLSNSKANVAIILYDDNVPNRNSGGDWRVPRPVFIQSDSAVDITDMVESPDNYEKRDFSQRFWEEAAKIYRITSPEYDDTPQNTDYKPENAENEFEVSFLNNIVAVLNNNGVSHEVWNHVLEDAQWNRIEGNETGDVNLFGEDETAFSESEFADNKYIPDPSTIHDWGLYSYSWRHKGNAVDSLWIRFSDDSDEIREYPLVENLHGVSSIVSINPDFGTIDSNHISEDVLNALENGTVVDSDDEVETALTEMVMSVSLSDKSSYFIQNATDSNRITE